uniref:Uncharacterized protein n=1 Tax=viral metagenome TaxID=1070528 RepID=A0A6M3IZT0_9ZZZZ
MLKSLFLYPEIKVKNENLVAYIRGKNDEMLLEDAEFIDCIQTKYYEKKGRTYLEVRIDGMIYEELGFSEIRTRDITILGIALNINTNMQRAKERIKGWTSIFATPKAMINYE